MRQARNRQARRLTINSALTRRVHDGFGTLLATITNAADPTRGMTEFVTHKADPLQGGVLVHLKGTEIKPHRHNPPRRVIEETCEALYVIKGSYRVQFWGDDGTVVQ